ncbi:MAG TPA: DUF805 domain-containing protein [Mycobacteriales bacterium]|nr:DUF805 domain-containing protein [Mycobacteriales bacterium]
MSFTEAVSTVLNKYADFSGRARRSEYWYWVLALALGWIVVEIFWAISRPLGWILYLVLLIGTIVPDLAVGVRRLHDTSRSGWWLLIALVPFVGGIILLVFMCLDSTPGPNDYGPSPKELSAPTM